MHTRSLNHLFHHRPYDLRCAYRILDESLVAWLSHRASNKGAALAFYTLFSLTPAQIFFLGAEFTRQYALYFGSLSTRAHPREHGHV